MAFVTGQAMTHKALRHSFALPDVLEMVSMVYGDRVQFHQGDDEVVPGVTVHHIGGHTRGLQAVRVNTKRGMVVLASDASHYYENFEENVTFTTVENIFLMHEGFRKLQTRAHTCAHRARSRPGCVATLPRTVPRVGRDRCASGRCAEPLVGLLHRVDGRLEPLEHFQGWAISKRQDLCTQDTGNIIGRVSRKYVLLRPPHVRLPAPRHPGRELVMRSAGIRVSTTVRNPA